MKLFYLCYFGASGVYFPYAGLYLGAIGLNGSQIGLIASTVPLAGVLLQPLWGLLSDRYGWRKRLLTTALLAAALTAPFVALAHSFALLLLPIALLDQHLHAAGMFLVAGLVCAVAIVGLLLVMPHTDMAQ